MPDVEAPVANAVARKDSRDRAGSALDWRFATDDGRVNLGYLRPAIQE